MEYGYPDDEDEFGYNGLNPEMSPKREVDVDDESIMYTKCTKLLAFVQFVRNWRGKRDYGIYIIPIFMLQATHCPEKDTVNFYMAFKKFAVPAFFTTSSSKFYIISTCFHQ